MADDGLANGIASIQDPEAGGTLAERAFSRVQGNRVKMGQDYPGEAKSIPHGLTYDASQALKSNFFTAGLGQYFEDLATEQPSGKPLDWRYIAAALESPTGSIAKVAATVGVPVWWLLKQMGRRGASDAGVAARFLPGQGGILGYHGSPHKFASVEGHELGRLDPEKMGTGQGSQVRGAGHYIAENPDTGKFYQEQLSRTVLMVDGKKIDPQDFPMDSPQRQALSGLSVQHGIVNKIADLRQWANHVEEGGTYRAAADWLESLGSRAKIVPEGHLYTFDIDDAAIAKMLDLDAPLTEEVISRALPKGVSIEDAVKASDKWAALRKQLESKLPPEPTSWAEVRRHRDNPPNLTLKEYGENAQNSIDLSNINKAASSDVSGQLGGLIKKIRAEEKTVKADVSTWGDMNPWTRTRTNGENLYWTLSDALGDPTRASSYLLERGFPGNKFLDAGSRSGKEGTQNFVIYPEGEGILKVVERKSGEEVKKLAHGGFIDKPLYERNF